MPTPHCAGTRSIAMELQPGTYWWCACGLSKTQPWCDGSHAGTEFSPTEFVVTEAKRYGLCTCKMSKNGPICDGSHKQLPQP
jgi:CDGSH iron-sulfur domain-containing protein 3